MDKVKGVWMCDFEAQILVLFRVFFADQGQQVTEKWKKAKCHTHESGRGL
jgi:hypothetical protein